MKWLRNNGLSVAFLALFVFSLIGQILTGRQEHNEEMLSEGGKVLSLGEYLVSGHFIQATFENWESEFLQMALFVVFTVFLYQKGSSESKDPDNKSEGVDREPDPKRKDAPAPVRIGGIWLSIYERSLSYILFLLFLLSFVAHWLGSHTDYNDDQVLKGLPTETAFQYLGNARFWFESFQNWQSEFLSVFAIVILSVFLRQKGSPQSKPVDAPNSETGEKS